MSTASAPSSLPRRSAGTGPAAAIGMLVVFLAISFAVAALGSLATLQNVQGWYADADKAFWTPPNAVFGPVWTVLYSLMSVAAWLVWLRRDRDGEPGRRLARRALGAYVAQLVLNAVWTPVFFGLYPFAGPAALWIGLAIIVLLDAAVLVTMLRFWPVRRLAALLLIPYWAWVLYATTLNAALAVLNP
ncbi:tryptophan-rich sensory protein [Schumannella luteola]|uniref:Tryptophan-rich sensory protein n=1 Tax=Schumannella luteola TaxID=472059 RepID=A0A852YEU4_9MICO|nr:TspO/MBR family protein [Schumannella luteola]NYG99671.1 tryptophan-rich sensory protein [Schumannella luteola]TPX04855.1 tryptophan-rich sensory protein [Schumannella luteola]